MGPAAVVTNRQKCACARVTRDLWFLVVGPNCPHSEEFRPNRAISVAPNLSTRLYNFLILITGHYFYNEFMFLSFLLFKQFSHSTLSDRYYRT
jgi:hypothetical protein